MVEHSKGGCLYVLAGSMGAYLCVDFEFTDEIFGFFIEQKVSQCQVGKLICNLKLDLFSSFFFVVFKTAIKLLTSS